MKNIAQKQLSDKAKASRITSTGWLLGTLSHHMDKQMSEQLKLLGLNLNLFVILMILFEKDGQTQVEIGQKAMMPGYTTTRVLDQLETLGYIERQRHETSRRSNRILLTKAGNEIAPSLFSSSEKVNSQIFSLLKDEEVTELQRLLSKMVSKTKK